MKETCDAVFYYFNLGLQFFTVTGIMQLQLDDKLFFNGFNTGSYKQNYIKYLNQKLKHQLGKQMVSTANHLIPTKLGLHNVHVYKIT